MQTIICEGLEIQLDNEGFLINPEIWDENIACAIARKEGIKGLTEEMLEIIYFIRDYYEKNDAFPSLTFVAKSLNKPINHVLSLFGHHARAWKIAGLPQPKGELSYLLGGF